MKDKIKVLLSDKEPEVIERVRNLSPRLEVVTESQVEADPGLLAEVEIAYGGAHGGSIREHLARATSLRWWQIQGAGANRVLTPEVRQRDFVLTNASGIHAAPISEHLFGMLLMTTRCLDRAFEQQRTRQWRGYDFAANIELLAGKTLGVLGVGEIGGQCARVGRAFGMRVVGLRRSGQPHPDVERMYGIAERLEFFAAGDVIMNTLPLTRDTRGFVGRAEFAAMRPGAIFQNVGRGATVDTDALLQALREHRLKAALLDVTDPEPLPEEHPLWTLDNVFITPHYSGSHPGYAARAADIFIDNLRRYLAGEPLKNVVDKAEGY